MSFAYPSFLFALFALAIPIIIHLFNFRKFKKVYFSNIRFLKEVKQQTQSKSKLKHLLVLISRILAIAFLVLAFAQPYIPNNNAKIITGSKAVSIYIDNSFSMDAVNKGGSLLDEAKNKAKEITGAYKPSDRFQLLTNDFEGRHQRLVNKEEFLELLDEVKISPAVKTLSEIVSRQNDALGEAEAVRKNAFIISDFQKSISDLDKVKSDTSVYVNFIPVLALEKKNVYIDSCRFSTPVRRIGQTEQLYVRIVNNSENDLKNNSIKLFINEKQKTPAAFDLEANSETEVILSFSQTEAGIQNCRLEINDFPVTFDDKFYFSFEAVKTIPVLSIENAGIQNSAEASYISSLFGNDSLFIFSTQQENKIDFSSFAKNKLIVLNELRSVSSGLSQELNKFIANGGSVLIIPSKESDLPSYQSFLTSVNANYFEGQDTANTKVDKINFEHEIYRGVFEKRSDNIDLPVVLNHYRVSKLSRSGKENLLSLQNGNSFLSRYSYKKGKVYLCSASLNTDFGNFARHAIFVPTLYQVAIYSQPVKPLFYTIGKNEIIETGKSNTTGENIFHITSSNSTFDFIPEHKNTGQNTEIYIHSGINEAGNYFLKKGDEIIEGISFNYDRKESDLSVLSNTELVKKAEEAGLKNFALHENNSKPLTDILAEAEAGKKFWKLCIILALVFLAIETLLLRYWKTQKHEPSTKVSAYN